MKTSIMLLTVLTLVMGMAAPSQAVTMTFYLNAWDFNQAPSRVGVQDLEFWVIFYDEDELVVGSVEMTYPGGGGLYFTVDIDDVELLEMGAETWAVVLTDDQGWDLVQPNAPFQFQGDISWNGNNPVDPLDWWLE